MQAMNPMILLIGKFYFYEKIKNGGKIMKTKTLRIGKRSLAMVLSLMMIVSSVFVGSLNGSAVTVDVESSDAPVKAEASGSVTVQNDGDLILYFKSDTNIRAKDKENKWNSISDWTADNAKPWVYIYNDSTRTNTWVKAEQVSTGSRYYYFSVPSGTWENLILTRFNPVIGTSQPDTKWSNSWNQTGKLDFPSNANCFEGDGDNYKWTKYKTTTASLVASDEKIYTGDSVTVVSTLDREDLFTISENKYSVNPTTGFTTNGNTFTFTQAGTYTITDKIDYYAKGFTSINDSQTKSVTIEVTAGTVRNNIGVKSQITDNGTKYTDKTVSGVTIDGNTTSLETFRAKVSAPSQTTINNATYKFVEWDSKEDGTFSDKSSATTTFYPAEDGDIAIAKYAKVYTVKVTAVNGKATVKNSSKATFTAGSSYTVKLTPSDGYELDSLLVNGDEKKNEVTTSENLFNGSNISSNVTVQATFKSKNIQYYLNGRFKIWKDNGNRIIGNGGWATGTDGFLFTHVEDSLYKLETQKTINALADNIGNGSNIAPYFYISKVENGTITNYNPSGNTNLNTITYSSAKYSTVTNSAQNFIFVKENSGNSNNGNITLWFNSDTNQFWYTRETDTIPVVAKDATLRNQGEGTYHKFATMADTTIEYTNTNNETLSTSDCYFYNNRAEAVKADVKKGESITIKTKIDSNQDTYYVKAFVINGKTVLADDGTKQSDGTTVYTAEYTIPTDQYKPVEITPVYFYKDTSNIIRFYVENFNEAEAAWGDTVACYAYYSKTQSDDLADSTRPTLGGFPGQPMVYENGRYYIEIPKTMTVNGTTRTILGMTINNYVWDNVHGDLFGDSVSEINQTVFKSDYMGDTNGANAANAAVKKRQSANHQTYDYDDFSVLSKRDDVDTIYFRFKYRTTENPVPATDNSIDNAKNNRGYGNIPANYKESGIFGQIESFENNWEIRRDHEDEAVDLFGNRIEEPDENARFYRVVSDGYIDNYIGHFATEWSIFAPDGKYITTLAPSALYYKPKNEDFLNKSKGILKPSKPAGFTGTYWAEYKKLYESGALNQPAKVTFETAIYGSGINGIPNDPAERCDGLWFVSEENVHANIIIEYRTKNSESWTEDYVASGKNTGTTTGASAYFTNTGDDSKNNGGVSFTNQTETSWVKRDLANTFNFAATNTGSAKDDGTIYKFVGWYLLIDGKYNEISYKEAKNLQEGSVDRSTSYTLVARYEEIDNTDLIVSHNLLSESTDETITASDNKTKIDKGTGEGTTTVKVEIYHKKTKNDTTGEYTLDDTPVYKADKTTDVITISNSTTLSKYNSSDYVMRITLTTTPKNYSDEYNSLYDRYVDKTDDNKPYYYRSDETSPISGTAVTKTNSSTNVTTNVYEFDVNDLYESGSLKTNALKYYSKITSNDKLTISHNLLKNSPDDVINVSNDNATDETASTTTEIGKGNGTGDTYVSVTILDKDGNPIGTQNYKVENESSVSIPKETLKTYADAGYKLQITLTTTPTDKSTFEGLYDRELNSSSDPIYYSAEKTNNDSNFGTPSSKSNTENEVTTTVYTIDAKDFFKKTTNDDGEDEITNELITKSVEYYSKLNASQTLTISHNLLTKAPDATINGTTGTIEKGAGTGETTVTAEIWNGGSKVGDATITTNEDGTVSIESSELKKYPNGTLKINLETKPASNSSFDSLYDRELSDLTDGTSVTYYGTNEEEGNKAKICGNASTQPDTNKGVTTTTYEVPISNLFNGDSLKTTALKFFSKLSQSIIINFKYYDRNIVNYSQPATIDTKETTVSISQTLDGDIETTISNALENPVDKNGKQIKMSEIGNVIDDYYFWVSQDQATGDDGIKARENYHIAPTVSGNEVNYTTYNDSGYNNLDYHLDCYGKPLTGTRTDADSWVSYITTDDKENPKKYLNGDESDFDLTKVTEVTVWGYNAPKIYYVDLLKPENDKDTLVKSSESENDQYKGFGDDVYIAQGKSSTPVGAFYNQRLGGYDKSSIEDDTNAAGAYLNEYGIGVEDGIGNAYVNTDNDAVTAVSEIKDGTGEIKYVFDGWYDVDTKQKISSDLVYGYRVTKTLSIVAGYKETGHKSTEVGVTVTSNGIDHYIDNNAPDQIQRVRLNTQVNVYNAYSEEGDDNIKNIAAIYVRVNNYDYTSSENYEALRTAISNHLKENGTTLGSKKFASETFEDSIEFDGQIIFYTYKVVFDKWSVADTSTDKANNAQLTNKNRIQFTLPMSEAAFKKNGTILSFAAIYYNGTNPEGKVYDGEWILSDNYVEFTPPAPESSNP